MEEGLGRFSRHVLAVTCPVQQAAPKKPWVSLDGWGALRRHANTRAEFFRAVKKRSVQLVRGSFAACRLVAGRGAAPAAAAGNAGISRPGCST